MPRTLARILLLAGLLLAGCARNADPLDWKIEGRHLNDLQESLDRIISSLPGDLRKEFIFCFNNIKADLLANRAGTREEQENRVCRRLRGKTVREILIEGNGLAYRAIAARILQESDSLRHVIEHSAQETEAQRSLAARRIEHRQARLEYLAKAIGKSDRRLAELWAPRSAP
jgi:hypothetical protein